MMYEPKNVADELLPVVNENDEVIGTEKRGIIHKNRLLHRAVHVLVFNPKGQIFIQQRSMIKDSAPGKWDSSSSGHVDPGETYFESAVRELQEELNIDSIPNPQEVAKLEACRQTGNEFTMIYSGVTSQEPIVNPHEIMDGKWIEPEKLDEWMRNEPKVFAGCFRLVWETFRKNNVECS